jgi:hypothetical protein
MCARRAVSVCAEVLASYARCGESDPWDKTQRAAVSGARCRARRIVRKFVA